MNSYIKQLFKILVLGGLLAPPAQAQNAGQVLTLDQFVKLSVGASQTVEVNKLTGEKSEDIVDEKKSAFLPTLNATAEVLETKDTSITQTAVNLNANLFKGFQDTATLKAAQKNRDQAKLNWSDSRYQEVDTALQTFFSLLQLESDVRNQQKEIEINEQNLKEAQRKLQYGGARKSEVISLQSNLANYRLSLIETQTSVNQTRVKAFRALGIESDNFQLQYANARCKIENINSIIAKMDPVSRADYKAQSAGVEASEQSLKAAKGKNLPSLDFTSSYILSDSQSNSQKDEYNVGLTLTIPFPFGLEKKSQVSQAAKDFAIAKVNQEKTLLDLKQAKLQLAKQLNDDVASIQALAEAKKLNEENMKAMKADHSSGLSTYSDVLDASSTYQQTLRKYDKALLQLDLDCYRALVWSADESQVLNSLKEESI